MISVIVSLLIGEVIKRVALLRALYFPFPVRKRPPRSGRRRSADALGPVRLRRAFPSPFS